MKNYFYFILLFSLTSMFPWQASAEQLKSFSDSTSVENRQRLSLARSFVSKMKSGFKHADKYLYSPSDIKNGKNIFEDGETLLLQPVLSKNLRVDGVILGTIDNNKVLLSLRDVTDILQIPISIDIDNKTAKGWYINEGNNFLLNIDDKLARTNVGEFKVSNDVVIKDNDIWIPANELGKWMDFEFNIVSSVQELRITSPELMPIQKRYNRRNASYTKRGASKPILPLDDEGYRAVSIPSVDIATSSTYRKNKTDEKGIAKHSVNIRSTGDFAYGTLTTQSRLNNDNQLASVRLNYKQESLDADLLGSVKARRFEVGDVITSRVPFGGQVKQELGVRVTNTDSLRTFNNPKTGISGTAFPGWDVELYRDNQIVGFREIGDDGFYSFDDVDLYLTNNNFKLIFYGPQGEIREEDIFIPVNQSLARGANAGIYDVSLSLNGENTYNKKVGTGADDEDDGSLNFSAFYEKPLMDGVTASAGLWSSERDGVRNSAVNLGVSAIVKQTLVNAGLAIDDEGDIYSEASFRRDIKGHEFRNLLSWRGDGFDSQSGGDGSASSALSNSFSILGPIPSISKYKIKPRYNFSSSYALSGEGDYSITTNAGVSASIKRVTINESMQHVKRSGDAEDTMSSFTNISGTLGRHRLRLGVDYAIMPNSELRSLLATYRRDFTKKLKLELGVTKRYQQAITEYSAKLDWQAGFMRISPSIRYNSEQDFFAGLNTRVGLLRDPSRKRLKLYDRNVTNTGAASAFVYLDKNGDGIFNNDDEPLEGVVIKAPQNGGQEFTDENGVAMFKSMGRLKVTDIYLDKYSLQDPAWVNSFDGVSVLPREGYVAQVEFPIHMSGEIDGSVYVRAVSKYDEKSGVLIEAKPVPLRNIRLKLYNGEGQAEASVLTDSGGFYYFPQVPPGRYFLIVDEKSAERGKFIRPEPQQIEITYQGNVIYGNDIFVDIGDGDIPSVFLPNLEDYKDRHPHIDFSNKDSDLVLNLGEYNSRLLMSVVWYKLRARYNKVLAGAKLFVPPTQSFANIKTGKHTLRIGLKNDVALDEAYNKCRSLMAREQFCKVEIYPSYMKHANADILPNPIKK